MKSASQKHFSHAKSVRIPKCIPQNDLDCFYNWSWYSDQYIPSNTDSVNNFTNSQDKIDDEMFDFITNGNSKGNLSTDPIYTNMAKLLSSYESRQKSKTISYLVYIISCITDVESLAKVLRTFNFFGISTLFTLGISSNFTKPDIYSLVIGEIDLTLDSRDTYENSKGLTKVLESVMAEIFSYIKENWSYDISDREQFISDVIMAEYLFSKTKFFRTDSQDPSKIFHSVLYKDFLEKYSYQNFWQIIFDSFLKPTDLIFYENDELLEFLFQYVQKLDTDSLRMLKNFLVYNLVRNFNMYTTMGSIFDDYSSKPFDEKDVFMKTFYGSFGYYLESVYESRHSNQIKNEKIYQMFLNIKHYCYQVYQSNTIFEPNTKKAALDKIQNLDIIIGKQDYFVDLNLMPELGTDFYQNLFIIELFYFRQMIKLIGKPRSRYELSINNDVYSFIVNAYYNASTNLIYVPTGIINDIFFDESLDPISHYGSFGTIIGHEMMHAFDKAGSQFDKNGHLFNWWTESDHENFNKELAKVNRHYRSLTVNTQKINADVSISENIADIGGLKLSLRTYLKHYMPNYGSDSRSDNKPDHNLSNLKSNEKEYLKKFFQGWVRTLRTYGTNDSVRTEIEFDDHAPSIVRMNAPFSHLAEYYAIFDVKKYHQNYLAPKYRTTILDR